LRAPDLADTVPAVRALVLTFGLVVVVALPAVATRGDLYARGTRYCTSTYSPGHDTPRGFGPPIDINASGGDLGRPVFAPDDGTVKLFSRTGIYGRSLVWRAADREERIHVAHLTRFVRRGEVRAGQLIARAGNTGHSFGEGHLHVARQVRGRPAALELSGRHVAPFRCYMSRGPLDRHRRPR
jgi:murein DD-endopeptidase MepM/ murein hydrolase activator NlpD